MYDIVIIGSGPAGLSASVYAKREMLNSIVIEKEFMGTGQIAESDRVDNYIGLYGESGYDLGEKFRDHAIKLGTEFVEGKVESILKQDNHYNLKLSNGENIETKTIILATGTSRRKLGIKGEKELTGKGVTYCAICDGAFYKDLPVAVVGGGDTALQDALLLSKIASKVYLIHRRDEFRGNKILSEKVRNTENIELVLSSTPKEIVGEKQVEKIIVTKDNSDREIIVSGVFVAVGSVPNSDLLKELVKLDNGYVVASEDGGTSADGIFVAGDVRTKKLRQVVTAVSDGANAVMSAEDYLLKNNL